MLQMLDFFHLASPTPVFVLARCCQNCVGQERGFLMSDSRNAKHSVVRSVARHSRPRVLLCFPPSSSCSCSLLIIFKQSECSSLFCRVYAIWHAADCFETWVLTCTRFSKLGTLGSWIHKKILKNTMIYLDSSRSKAATTGEWHGLWQMRGVN